MSEKWKSQILRGTLEYCVLIVLKQSPCYGYQILQKLNAYSVLSSTESTVYPLLRRLQKDCYLDSYWQDSAEGLPPRKYYTITELGENYLNSLHEHWQHLTSCINHLKGEST